MTPLVLRSVLAGTLILVLALPGWTAQEEEKRVQKAPAEEHWVANVRSFVDAFSGRILNIALVLMGVGGAAMALIETAKNIIPIHRWYYRNKVLTLLGEFSQKRPPGEPHKPNLQKATEDLIFLAAAGDAKALFSLPVEQMVGQIGAAARSAIDYPKKYLDLLLCLAFQAEGGDIDELLRDRKDPTEMTSQEKLALADARNRVSQQVQRSLDAMQILIKAHWTWFNQLFAVILSATLIFVALYISDKRTAEVKPLALYLLLGIVGGFLAPVAKDLVGSLQKLRK